MKPVIDLACCGSCSTSYPPRINRPELALQIDHADCGSSWNTRGARERVEQHRMFVAIARLGFKHLQSVRDTDGGLFLKVVVDPVFEAQYRSVRVGFWAEDLDGMITYRWMVALQECRRL